LGVQWPTKGKQAVDELVDWTAFSEMRTELGASFVRILSYFREDGEKAVSRIEDAMHRGDAAALVLPAHTLKAEARQFGAEPVAALAEEIERAGRRAVESHLFPDNILPQVAQLRPLYNRTLDQLEAETNPLAVRRGSHGRGPSNQEFGRL
jgi:HPt (histidine-containing phosphotransfer) domain-containing protein